MRRKKQWLDGLLCRIGWHQRIGITVADFIRCYACGQNLHPQDGVWRREMPPDLQPAHVAEADELRRVLDGLTTAIYNRETDFTCSSEYAAAMIALGYRQETNDYGDPYWRKP